MPLVLLTILFIPAVALCESEPWLKKDDPNEMNVKVLLSDDCPVTQDEVEQTVRDEWVRSRVKMVDWSDPFFVTDINCMTIENGYVMSVSFDFVTGSEEAQDFVRLGLLPFGGFNGHGDKQLLLRGLRDSIGKVIANYLRANFDLED